MVQRIADLDIPRRLSGVLPAWATKIGCAILGVGLAVVLRLIVDHVTPGAGAAPYAFVYPAALLATLLGGWQSGVGTLLATEWLAWIFVVPKSGPGGTHTDFQAAAAILVGVTVIAVIAVGEAFRVAAQRIVTERNAKLAERELLFRELQHRVNNDFTIVNSLLDLQRRKSADAETRGALEQAMGRIRSVARVHHHLYVVPDIGAIDLKQYLTDLCGALAQAAFPPAGLSLRCHCEEAFMPRSRAIAVGLVTNELVTNAVKHAFPGGREGVIDVRFQRTETGWALSVRDDGVGLSLSPPKSGLGTSLVEEFARQAGGTLSVERDGGTVVRLVLAASAATAGGKDALKP
ncbi:MAG TPA: sensor histidine kinase [Rhizomicrobium sp.]|nr:sensor histidine kinase [Rhizomicrobium sp.]